MNQKEKAKDLVDKFRPHVLQKDFFGDSVEHDKSKQCALIVVDEIIKSNPCSESCDMGGNFMFINNVYYWQQVKTEIHNL